MRQRYVLALPFASVSPVMLIQYRAWSEHVDELSYAPEAYKAVSRPSLRHLPRRSMMLPLNASIACNLK